MSCRYCYVSNRLVVNGVRDVSNEKPPLQGGVEPIAESTNPVFNFNSDFVRQYQSISNTDLALAVPYISLASIAENGAVLQDFNLAFFTRGIDLNALSAANRYGDRPDMSLVDVRVSSNLSNGNLYLQSVSVGLKIHKPNDRASIALISVLYPGGVFRLQYGWNCPNNGNQFLNQKETLYFSVSNYTIDFNIQGEAEISIEGLAMSDSLNVLVGDRGSDTPVTDDDKVTMEQVDGIQMQQVRRQGLANYAAENAGTRTASNDLSIKDQLAKSIQQQHERACKSIRAEFKTNMDYLERLKQTSASLFPDAAKRSATGAQEGEYVLLHDLIRVLCGRTLDSLHGPFVPSNATFRFMYGAFNNDCVGYANRSLADFPVHWKTFKSVMSKHCENGGAVPTLRNIIRIMTDEFMNNAEYWRNNLAQDYDDLKVPQTRFQVSTHTVGEQRIVQMLLMDERKDVPATQQVLHALGRQGVSDDEIERAVAGDNIPVIRIGHNTSFVREMHLSHIDDATMRTIFLNRALANTVSSPRLPATADKLMGSQKGRPFVLPLQGELEVIGHIEWRPMRFFYLRTGIYLLDGIYKVTRVEHTLDAGGFSTTVGFTYH